MLILAVNWYTECIQKYVTANLNYKRSFSVVVTLKSIASANNKNTYLISYIFISIGDVTFDVMWSIDRDNLTRILWLRILLLMDGFIKRQKNVAYRIIL